MLISVGISDHSLAYLTGVTDSCGSRSMCMCNISRQKAARRSHDSILSAIHLRMSFTSSCLLMLLIARYCLSRHIWENRFNWYLWGKEPQLKMQCNLLVPGKTNVSPLCRASTFLAILQYDLTLHVSQVLTRVYCL